MKISAVLICLFSLTLLGAFPELPVSVFSSENAPVEAYFDFGKGDGTFPEGQKLQITYAVKNVSSKTVKGFVAGSVSTTRAPKIIHQFKKYLEVPPGQTQRVSFDYQPRQAGVYQVFIRYRNMLGTMTAHSARMAYAPEKINPPLSRKEDFDAFWQNTLRALKNIPPNFRVEAKSSLSTPKYQVYLIEMQSLDNMTIRGWYRVPKYKKNVPVILQLPSLGGSFYNVRSLEEKPRHGIPYDFAVLSLNIRGHGNSKDVIDYGEDYNRLISHGLEQKETYIYRGAVADCIRALDFLYTRPELDLQKIAVEGGSQGGALSLITTALDRRVKLCAPDVPFLCDTDHLVASAAWVETEIHRYVRQQSNLSMWRALYHLSYFDTKNFADRIQVPVMMSIGLQDRTCPAATSLATYNQVKAPKTLYVYPEGKHEGGGALHRQRKFAWIRQHWGM